MRPQPALFCLAVCVCLAGCGASHRTASSSISSTTTTTTVRAASTATPPRAGILGRVITNNELTGFGGSPHQIATNARSWLGGKQDPALYVDQSRLTRLGFIRGVREDLSDGGTAGLSEVAQFRSDEAARAELAAEIAEDKGGSGGPYKAFAVPGIPGAEGFSLIAGGSGGINIAFVKGPYFYLVGREVGPGTGSVSSDTANLIAAAEHLYHRVSS
jgi:hypothetical protein